MTRSRNKRLDTSSNADKSNSTSVARRNPIRCQTNSPGEESRLQAGSGADRHPLLQLQQQQGNQAVQRAVKERIQPKLEVGRPDDKYEREADRVADQVMRMPEPVIAERPKEDGLDARVQRMCSRCQERFQQGKQLNCSSCEETIQRKEISSESPSVRDSIEQQIQSSRGGGRPLPEPVRSTFEPQFGRDFSDVRVHDGQRAAELNRALNARAFAYGRDVYFGVGNYNPSTETGQRLLAHELTHVVQQNDVNADRIRRQPVSESTAQPQSLTMSVDPNLLSEPELEREVRLIHQWLLEHPESSEETEHLRTTLLTLESKIRDSDEQQPRVDQSSQADIEDPRITGKDVLKHGIVSGSEGVNLRDIPSTGPESTALRRLPFNTHLFVHKEYNDWYHVTLTTGEYGYVYAEYVKTNLPEPRAKLHKIQSGESAIGIAEQYYKSHAQEWGQDLRFYVNVLEFVNRGEGERGIYRVGSSWETTKTRSGYLVWIPSVSFAKQLRGTVSSGSITHEAWESIKSAAVAVGEFIVGGGAFVAGLLHGALESVWDLLVGLKDLVVMVWDILKSLLTGEILSDAKSLWNQVSNLDVSQIAEAWINNFEKKWDHESLLKRWHFRGWVLGYAIAEIVMLIFSGGAAAAAKWGGKMAKVAKVIEELPAVARLAKKARSVDVPDAVKKALAKGADATTDALKVARAWASTRLNLGAEILKDLTLEAINRFRTLSEPLLNKLRDLSTATKKFVLGCRSECKVDIDEIKRYIGSLPGKVIKAHEINWKGFSKGKRREHFDKHGSEFDAVSENEYWRMAKEFAAKTSEGVEETMVGNHIFKYDSASNTLLIGNSKKRLVKTFYKPDNGIDGYYEAIAKHREVLKKLGHE